MTTNINTAADALALAAYLASCIVEINELDDDAREAAIDELSRHDSSRGIPFTAGYGEGCKDDADAELGHRDFIGIWSAFDFDFDDVLDMSEEEIAKRCVEDIQDALDINLETNAEYESMR